MKIEVNGYSGFRLNERPKEFYLDGHHYAVLEVLDQWHSPDSICFKVAASDGNHYIFRFHQHSDAWTLESYLRPARTAGEKAV